MTVKEVRDKIDKIRKWKNVDYKWGRRMDRKMNKRYTLGGIGVRGKVNDRLCEEPEWLEKLGPRDLKMSERMN